MPALITHHIFGEDVIAGLPDGIVSGEEEKLAFLLANQGPDPLLARFSALPATARACHRLARLIQGGCVTRAFWALRDGVSRLPAADKGVGRAFALGFLGHYALDRAAHPLVVSQQRALVEADRTLAAVASDVHAVIESDIDSWILWEKRGATVLERPAAGNLMRTERVERVGGALVSQLSLAVFGLELGAREYAGSVRDLERAYRLIDPAGSPRARAVSSLERLARGRSWAAAAAHYVRRGEDCPAANLGCLPWRDPFTGRVRSESLADLFDEARLSYPALAEAFVRGDRGGFRRLVGGLDYAGRPGTDD